MISPISGDRSITDAPQQPLQLRTPEWEWEDGDAGIIIGGNDKPLQIDLSLFEFEFKIADRNRLPKERRPLLPFRLSSYETDMYFDRLIRKLEKSINYQWFKITLDYDLIKKHAEILADRFNEKIKKLDNSDVYRLDRSSVEFIALIIASQTLNDHNFDMYDYFDDEVFGAIFKGDRRLKIQFARMQRIFLCVIDYNVSFTLYDKWKSEKKQKIIAYNLSFRDYQFQQEMARVGNLVKAKTIEQVDRFFAARERLDREIDQFTNKKQLQWLWEEKVQAEKKFQASPQIQKFCQRDKALNTSRKRKWKQYIQPLIDERTLILQELFNERKELQVRVTEEKIKSCDRIKNNIELIPLIPNHEAKYSSYNESVCKRMDSFHKEVVSKRKAVIKSRTKIEEKIHKMNHLPMSMLYEMYDIQRNINEVFDRFKVIIALEATKCRLNETSRKIRRNNRYMLAVVNNDLKLYTLHAEMLYKTNRYLKAKQEVIK